MAFDRFESTIGKDLGWEVKGAQMDGGATDNQTQFIHS